MFLSTTANGSLNCLLLKIETYTSDRFLDPAYTVDICETSIYVKRR